MVNPTNNKGQGLIEFLVVVTVCGLCLSWFLNTGSYLLAHKLTTHWLQEYSVCQQIHESNLNCDQEFQKRMKGGLPWYQYKLKKQQTLVQGVFQSTQPWAKDFQITIQIHIPLRRGGTGIL